MVLREAEEPAGGRPIPADRPDDSGPRHPAQTVPYLTTYETMMFMTLSMTTMDPMTVVKYTHNMN
jgi:hypothetical protein